MIYLKLFLEFFKIGAFTFGGGYAMLPLIQETVLRNGWLDQKQLIDFIAVSESTPGPFAVNISTYIGERTAGLPGALCNTWGSVAIIYHYFDHSQMLSEILQTLGSERLHGRTASCSDSPDRNCGIISRKQRI